MLAQLVTHIPNKGERMVRYYSYYSNKSRGMRKKACSDDQVPALVGRQPPLTAARSTLDSSMRTGSARHGLFSSLIPWNRWAMDTEEMRREMVNTLCGPVRYLMPASTSLRSTSIAIVPLAL